MRETELLAGGNYAKPYLDLLQAVRREALIASVSCRTTPYLDLLQELDLLQAVKREAL